MTNEGVWVAAIRAAVARAGGAGVQLTAPGDSRAKAVAVRRAARTLAERGEIELRRERVDGRPRLAAYPSHTPVRVVGVSRDEPARGSGGRVTPFVAALRAANPGFRAWADGNRPRGQHNSKGTTHGGCN